MKESLETFFSNKATEIQIVRHSLDQDAAEEELVAYAAAKRAGEPEALGNFNDYIKDKYYKDVPNAIVVADLNGHTGPIEGVDLSGADLSGTLMRGVTFQNCNMSGACFCDTDLQDVSFTLNSKLTNADFRGADLSGVRFDQSYQKSIDPASPAAENIRGIKFSTTQALERIYLRECEQIEKEFETRREQFYKEKEALIEQKQAEIDQKDREAKGITPDLYGLGNALWFTVFNATPNPEVDVLKRELRDIESRNFTEQPKYLIHPSVLNVMGFERDFDPAYVRGLTAEERAIPKQYIKLTRAEVEDFLILTQTNPNLTLNDYAALKAVEGSLAFQQTSTGKNFVVSNKALLVADCSGLDLSGLHFTDARLQGSCFAGAKVEGCDFTNANINRASFQGARVKGAIFENTSAKDTNFFNSDLNAAKIDNSDFSRAFMSHSKAEKAEINNSDFHYARIQNGKWDSVKIVDSNFNDTNLEGITLINAYMKGVSAKQAILNDAILQKAAIIKCDFQSALMHRVHAQNAKFEEAMLKDVDAPFANLEGVDFGKLANLEGIHLENAIMDLVKAEEANFQKAHMEGASLRNANLKSAILEEAKMAFADLEGAVLQQANAHKIDMTGCKLQKVNAEEAIFTEGILDDINAREANFNKAVMQQAVLRGANLKDALMEKVNLEKAKVNAATNFAGANIEGTTGKMEMLTPEGKVKDKVTAKEQKELSDKVAQAENAGIMQKIGQEFKEIAEDVKEDAATAKKVFNSTTAMIVGGVVFALAAVAVSSVIIATGGFGGAIALGVMAGVSVAAGGAGAGIGYVASQNVGKIGKKTDKAIKALDAIGEGAEKVASLLGDAGGELGKQGLKEKEAHKAATKEEYVGTAKDKTKDMNLQQQVLAQKEMAKEPKGTLPKLPDASQSKQAEQGAKKWEEKVVKKEPTQTSKKDASAKSFAESVEKKNIRPDEAKAKQSFQDKTLNSKDANQHGKF